MAMENKKRGIPLSLKILLPLFVGGLVIVTSGWFYFKQHYTHEMEEQINHRAESMANSIDQFLWIMGDSSELGRIINSLGAEKDVEQVTIFQCNPFKTIAVAGEQLSAEAMESKIS